MTKKTDPRIEAFLASKSKLGLKTIQDYRNDLYRFGRFLEGRATPPFTKMYTATQDDLNRFFVHLRRDNLLSSARRKFAPIRGFYQYERQKGRLQKDPTEGLDLPVGQRRTRHKFALTREQIAALLQTPNDEFALRDKAILHFYYSGPKRHELPGVLVGDFDYERCELRVRKRVVPLTQQAADAINDYIAARQSRHRALFLTISNTPITVRQAWVRLKKWVRVCGLREDVDIETLRTSYAVHAFEDGVWLLDVLNSLGNVNFAALHEYAKLATPPERRLPQAHVTFLDLLQLGVVTHSMRHYNDGDYREAVSNAMLALTELIRAKTGLDGDGVDLASRVLRPENPALLINRNRTQSDIDEQRGFHKILLGAFEGVRNPKAHTIVSDLTPRTAAQYLILISLLYRRIDEARLPT